MRKVRCAIYTRKSSEEGLEQEFNSLDAQREACAAYIASQKHEGWVQLPDQYDDGGISGGTLERDGLRRLMAQVDEGLVDQIVVYKIDRLTRSLADFAKLVDRLDGAGASFVSVTQSFNTATSMGRLTLNVLLSFAQFEREVTAERIRDKIAASKKKGLWMGGNVPLGYEPDGRTLKINQIEADTVRTLYQLYREHGSITATTEAARKLQLRSKRRSNGKVGKLLGRGHVHAILINPLYVGRIRHKQLVHEGQHEAIIAEPEWDAVQDRLKGEARRRRGAAESATGKPNRSLLCGKVFDETGEPLTPTHANKKGRRYRYYISNSFLRATKDSESPSSGWRLPAVMLEQQVAEAAATHMRSQLLGQNDTGMSIKAVADLQKRLDAIEGDGQHDAERSRFWCGLVTRVRLTPGQIAIKFDRDAVQYRFETMDLPSLAEPCWTCTKSFSLRRRGVEAKLIIGDAGQNRIDQALVDNIARAHRVLHLLKSGNDYAAISKQTALSVGRIKQLLRMAFLAPDIVRDILQGRQPIGLTSEWLQRNEPQLAWHKQRKRVSLLS